MIRIPKTFTIKNRRWKVVYKDLDDADGICNYDNRTIYLQPGLGKRKLQFTFLHELFHATVHEAHINRNVRFSEGVEEVLCDAFADLLTTDFNRLRK